MNEIPAGDPPIRERIMEVFRKRFLAQQRGVNGAAVTWDVVERRPLTSDEQSRGYALAIFDTSQKKKDLVGKTECYLNCVFEFYVTLSEGDEPGTFGNTILAEVQRVAMLDLNMAEGDGFQLTVDVQEKGDELEIIAPEPNHISGVLVVEVTYRHKSGKPSVRA